MMAIGMLLRASSVFACQLPSTRKTTSATSVSSVTMERRPLHCAPTTSEAFGSVTCAPLTVIGMPNSDTTPAAMPPVNCAIGTLNGSTKGSGTAKSRKAIGNHRRRSAAVPSRNHTRPAISRIIARLATK